MIYTNVTQYLVAVRAWFDGQRRAAMRGQRFDEPRPELRR